MLLDYWREAWYLRAIVVLIVWALVVMVVFVWFDLPTWSKWPTLIGFGVAGLGLFLNPILEDMV